MTTRVPVDVRPWEGLWRFASRDGRLLGIFVSRQAAVRAARNEVRGHPDYVLTARIRNTKARPKQGFQKDGAAGRARTDTPFGTGF